MHGYCHNCRKSHAIVERFGATIAMSLAGTLLGASARHPLAMLLFGLVGATAGRALDERLAATCPECDAALHIVAALA